MLNGSSGNANPIEAEHTVSQGWMATITDYLNFDSFLSKFNLSTGLVLETLGYGAAGFFAGVLVKRYAQQVIIGILTFFILIKGLEYIGIGAMTLNWARVKELTGITPDATFGSMMSAYGVWLQQHVRQTVTIVIGFLVGYKVA